MVYSANCLTPMSPVNPLRIRKLLLCGVLSAAALPALATTYSIRIPSQGLVVPASSTIPPASTSPAAACDLPWGGTLASGAPAITAYTQSTVPYGSSCSSAAAQVSCSQGALVTNGATSGTCQVLSDSDPYWNNVTLLLQGEGNAADSSSTRAATTVVGNTQVSYTQVKYGSGSLAFDGNGDYVDAGSNSRFAFGLSDFTVEAWAKSNVAAKNNAYLLMLDATGGFSFGIENGRLLIGRRATATDLFYSYSVDLNWHHYAVSRTAGIVRIFVDGIQVAQAANSINYAVAGPARIGGFNLAGYEWSGYMDDVRITTGVARYVGNFTPPSRQAPTR
jgi:hypothetical protein